jgi:hypothetical protein
MPLNRFITFVKPYLNLLAGAIAAWLIAKANVLGISGLGENGNQLQTGIAAALAWGLTQGVTEIGDMKWLKGHHLAMAGDALVQAAVLNTQTSAPAPAPVAVPETAHDEFDEPIASDESLPSDEEEFADAAFESHAGMPAGDTEVDSEGFTAIEDDDLPDDEEEYAAPPPDETNMPVQPSQLEEQGVAA